jgi:long-chain acyl-CoA synthetase
VYLRDFASSRPDHPAVVMGGSGRRVTYRELDERSLKFARALAELGLRRGDHYAVVMENHPSYYEVVWAGLRSGLYVTAVNSHLTPAEAGYVVDDCGAQVVVTSSGLADLAAAMVEHTPRVRHRLSVGGEPPPGHRSYEEVVEAQPPELPEGEQRGMVMLYSSGTTGRPKGIEFPLPPPDSPLGEWEIAEHSRVRFGYGDDMVYLSPAPLYHAAPLRISMAVQCVGGTVVVMERFDPAEALALIERERVTHSQWVPTMFVRMLKLPEEERSRYDLSSHRVAAHAAAPCPVEVKERMIEWWGPIIEEYYAGTEHIGSTAITSEEWLAHRGSVGRPSYGAVVHICDDAGRELPVGETGTVYFEDHSATFEYHGDREKTESLRHPDHPEWRTLGDVGRLDEDGYLYLTDRKAFMIVSGGVNIYPREIEDVLVSHPLVLDAAVFGVPNDDMGEEVKAVVQPLDPGDAGDKLEAELRAWCEERLAPYKRPRSYDFQRQLPRLDNGKLYKAALRESYWQGHSSRVL